MARTLVDKAAIDTLVTGMIAYGQIAEAQATAVGHALWAANLATAEEAFACRVRWNFYANTPPERDYDPISVGFYRYEICPGRVDPEVLIAAAEEFDHRCAGDQNWRKTAEFRRLELLVTDARERLHEYQREFGYLPHYHICFSGGWQLGAAEITSRDIFTRAAKVRADHGTTDRRYY